MIKTKDYYISEYIKIEQDSIYKAFEEGCFGNTTKEEKEFMELYKNTKPTLKDMRPLWKNKLYSDITNRVDCFDSNDIIASFGDLPLTDDYEVGYWLFWHGDDAYVDYVGNSSVVQDNIKIILRRLSK